MKKAFLCPAILYFIVTFQFVSCKQKEKVASADVIQDLDLKRGELISCGPADKQFGTVDFQINLKPEVKEDFNLALKLLHSFEYDEAEKIFAKVIEKDPSCAMAYWGVAMSNFHPLWTAPTEAELIKGNKAIDLANSIKNKPDKEKSYIDAISAFYHNWEKTDHRTRCINFEKKMDKLHADYSDDIDAAIFYALALDAAADPTDKTFSNQKKAGALLNRLYQQAPNHPGIIHYIIHSYDSPELAWMALPAARKYAKVAPSSAHALHMPSHIFTRLGLWNESIESNLASVASAKCYAESTGIEGHWDEELHGLDYLVYAYLQTGNNEEARKQLDYLGTFRKVTPANFKVAYAFASIPSRYFLENRYWQQAAERKPGPEWFDWKGFGWQKAIIYFSRALGAIHTGHLDAASEDLLALQQIHNELLSAKDSYKANQLDVQVKTIEAWMLFKQGKNEQALERMTTAAEMEDKTDKHPVTPGEVIPARELLGDLLLEMNKPNDALIAYQTNLKIHPNRFNGLYGAAQAAERSGNAEKAVEYYKLLVSLADEHSNRPELLHAKEYVKKNK